MAQHRSASVTEDRRARSARLGFRVAQHTIARHEMLVLSDLDRKEFFQALINTPKPNARLRKAFKAQRGRVAP